MRPLREEERGARRGDRTPDPQIKNLLLYQLSYTRMLPVFPGRQKYYGPHFVGGSGYWIRTNDYGDQNPMPYRLAKPPYLSRSVRGRDY